jgi:CBS domain-containing protein
MTMKVSEVMTRTPAYCNPETNLGEAVEIMWVCNCGALPVVDTEGRVVSVITDRDICIALGTRNRLASDLTVADVSTQRVISCDANEDISSALTRMAKNKVRRLPVINAQGKLEGILSMDDVVGRTNIQGISKGEGLTSEDIVTTLKTLYSQQLPGTITKATAA